MKDVIEDSRGNIWFATWGGGTVRYDGETFYNLTTKDGLAHNNISRIHESSNKDIWFTTEGGVTQYTPTRGGLPECRLTSLEADNTYTDLSSSITLPSRGTKIFNIQGISPLREGLSYKFKLIGLDTPTWTDVSAEEFSLLATGSGFHQKRGPLPQHRARQRNNPCATVALSKNSKTKMGFYVSDIQDSKRVITASSSMRFAKTGPTHIPQQWWILVSRHPSGRVGEHISRHSSL